MSLSTDEMVLWMNFFEWTQWNLNWNAMQCNCGYAFVWAKWNGIRWLKCEFRFFFFCDERKCEVKHLVWLTVVTHWICCGCDVIKEDCTFYLLLKIESDSHRTDGHGSDEPVWFSFFVYIFVHCDNASIYTHQRKPQIKKRKKRKNVSEFGRMAFERWYTFIPTRFIRSNENERVNALLSLSRHSSVDQVSSSISVGRHHQQQHIAIIQTSRVHSTHLHLQLQSHFTHLHLYFRRMREQSERIHNSTKQ